MEEQSLSSRPLLLVGSLVLISIIGLLLANKVDWSNINTSRPQTAALLPSPTQIPPSPGSQTVSYIKNGDVWTSSDTGKQPKQITHDGFVVNYFWLKSQPGLIFDSINAGSTEIIVAIKKIDLTTKTEKALFTRRIEVSRAGGIYPDYSYSFSISPDENTLAYDGDFLDSPSQMAIENLTTGEVKYTHDIGRIDMPDSGIIFSPDSKYLIEVPFIGSDYNLKLLSLADLSLRPLTSKYISPYDQNPRLYGDFIHPYSAVAWSPEGNKFYYYLSNVGAGGMHQSQQIYQFDLNTSTESPVTLPTPDSIQNFLYLTPDGKEIYYDLATGYTSRTLEKTNVVDKQTVSYPLPTEVTHLQVSPRGEPIIFEMDGVWIMNSDGSNLHEFDKDATNPKWVPE